jgi:hypothetical protein
MTDYLVEEEVLRDLIPRIFESKICTQIFQDSHYPLSLHLLRNPFNIRIAITSSDGTKNGDTDCFLGVDPQKVNLPISQIKIYVIPADPQKPDQPQNYSNPKPPTPH